MPADSAAVIKAKSDLMTKADKNLDTAYKTVEKIKNVGYDKFYEQISRVAYALNWHAEIFDYNTIADTDKEIFDDIAIDDVESVRRNLDRRNAYLIIMRAGDGHTVESLIQNLPRGNPRALLDCIHNFELNYYWQRNTLHSKPD